MINKIKQLSNGVKYVLLILIISGFLLPVSGFAQEQTSEPPATLEEAKELGEKTLEVTKEELPGILERIWNEEVLPLWQRMWNWTKNFWKDTIWPGIKGFWERRIKPPVEEEVEKRKEIIEENIEKEKEELEETLVPETAKPLWEKLKDLFQ
ncbi:MAG TPA: hypothetical protein VMV66_03110 [Candidatus Humimicrobiaceae bacterium]|nr:hypothetical protein [Candidatus Humimicrobiaceae bacterium]